MTSTIGSQIEAAFRDSGRILDDKLVAKCTSIVQMYGLKPDDLLYKVEAVDFKGSGMSSAIAPTTMDTLIAVEKKIQQDLAKGATAKPKLQMRGAHVTAHIDRSRMPNQAFQKVAPRIQPPIKQEHPGELSSIPPSSTIVTSNVSFVGSPADSSAKKKRAYRYMYEKILERSEGLDELIDDFADLIREHYALESDFGDPSASTDKEVVIVGRITHDAETAPESKLAEGAIVIESSRMISGGSRALLKLDPTIKIRGAVKDAGGFGLYPGQIAAFKGKNGGGGYFLATEFLSVPPLKPSAAAQGIVNSKLDPLASQNPVTMFFACGPFTSETDLMFRPWRSLLQQIKAQKPDVGPFIDTAHKRIKEGDMDVSPANLFKAQFIDPLKGFLTASPGGIVLLVPSVRDLVSSHAAFPQPELDADLFSFNPRIHLLPNPARFTINDIAFATTSVDTLFHLRKEEYTKRGIEVEPLPASIDDFPTDSMANLCRHLLLQRSFYPIFPPPHDLSSEVNLDMSHFDGVRMVDEGDLDYAPDVMILPSRLKQFSKVIHSTTTVNPSFLSKGSYGKITIAPRSAGTPKDRVKADVAKIDVPTAVGAPPPPVPMTSA